MPPGTSKGATTAPTTSPVSGWSPGRTNLTSPYAGPPPAPSIADGAEFRGAAVVATARSFL